MQLARDQYSISLCGARLFSTGDPANYQAGRVIISGVMRFAWFIERVIRPNEVVGLRKIIDWDDPIAECREHDMRAIVEFCMACSVCDYREQNIVAGGESSIVALARTHNSVLVEAPPGARRVKREWNIYIPMPLDYYVHVTRRQEYVVNQQGNWVSESHEETALLPYCPRMMEIPISLPSGGSGDDVW